MLWKLSGNLSNKLIETQTDCKKTVSIIKKRRELWQFCITLTICVLSYRIHDIIFTYLTNLSVFFRMRYKNAVIKSGGHTSCIRQFMGSILRHQGRLQKPLPHYTKRAKELLATPNIYPSKWSHYLPVNWFKVSDKLSKIQQINYKE